MQFFRPHLQGGGRVWRVSVLLVTVFALAACGGADEASRTNTITASSGGAQARVASAASLPVTVRAAQDAAGAPPVPTGALEPLGAIQQFTPMGLTAPGLEIAIPFNPQLLDSGAQPRLLVAQPGGEWTLVADARVETQDNTSRLVAAVPQLGYAVVVQVPAEAAASSADGKAKSAGTSVRITAGQPLVTLQLQSSQPVLAPQPEGADLFRVNQATALVQSVRVDFNSACAPKVEVYGVLAKMVGDQLNTQVFTLASRAYPVGSTSAAFTATHTLDAAHNGSYATFASATCTRTVGGSWANQVLSRVPAVALGQYFEVNVQAPVALPQITQAPQNASVQEGSSASFSVTAAGAAPLAYQWQRSANGSDWANVPGATGASLSLTATLADHGSLWRVIVSNASGQATSAPAQLSVTQQLIAPSIGSQPQDQSVVEGQNASFSVAASGQPAPSIQWQTRMLDPSNTETGWADIAGATGNSYTTPATTLADHQRQFRARISNSAGSLNSAAATLSVSARLIAPSITQQPVGAEVIEGASADFSVAASGSSPLSYQWFKDGVALVGANGATVSIPTSAADAGKTRAITVQVSNGAGQVTSQAASLVVVAADTGTVSGLIKASEGGSLSTANGAATLDVPAGALSGDATLTLKTVSPAGFTLPEGATPVGEVIVVGPAGVSFNQPVGISIPTPEDIPDGFALAIIELPDAGGAMVGGQKARTAAAKMRAQAATDNVFSCLQPQATVGGFTFAAIAQAARAAFVQVPSEACSLIGAPLLQTVGAIGKVPSDTTDACGADSDFIRPGGIDPFEGHLVSRHVACGRFQESNLDVDVPAKDAQGAVYIEPKAAKMALDVMWSIHGKPGGGASKKLTLKIKQSIAIVSSNVSATTTLPTVKVLARSDCTAQSGPAVTCASTRNFDLPTNGVATFTLDMPFNWDASERAWSEFVPGLELLYSSDGAAPDTEVSGRTSQVYRGLEVRLRCDVGLAQSNSSGCVLPDAAPVLVLRSSDGPEAVQHMREAMDPNGPIKAPGAFKLKPGTRAIADPSVADKGLQYAKLNKVKRRNRFASCNRDPEQGALGLIVTRPGGKSVSCQANETGCQCDEYPFAASWNGGAIDPNRTSVKMIKGSDNEAVGGKYGRWLGPQRVLDFTTFADGPFTPLDTDVPTYESADTFWIHIQ